MKPHKISKKRVIILSNRLLRTAFLDTLPVMAGYVFLGFGFGILMHQCGFGVLWAGAMSLFIYAGSMQYRAVDLLTGGAGLITAALTTLMVNARHLFYGLAMLEKYTYSSAEKLTLAESNGNGLVITPLEGDAQPVLDVMDDFLSGASIKNVDLHLTLSASATLMLLACIDLCRSRVMNAYLTGQSVDLHFSQTEEQDCNRRFDHNQCRSSICTSRRMKSSSS